MVVIPLSPEHKDVDHATKQTTQHLSLQTGMCFPLFRDPCWVDQSRISGEGMREPFYAQLWLDGLAIIRLRPLGETWCGRHEALTAREPALLAPATPFHLNVLADY